MAPSKLPSTASPEDTTDQTAVTVVMGRPPSDLAAEPSLTYNPLRSVLRAPTDLPRTSSHPARPSAEELETTTPPAPPSEAFELLEPLAQGGFGEVWIGRQRDLDRQIAVKGLRRDRLHGASPDQRRLMELQFRQEALTTARLEHPNIVPVYQVATDQDGNSLLGLKLVRGRPWNESIRESRARLGTDLGLGEYLQRHLTILISVAQAVAFAHSRGILHRDLKPHQVMVGEFGEVQLMDWGIASPFAIARDTGVGDGEPTTEDSSSSAIGGSYGPAGTPSFMAPEQTLDTPRALGPWTDLYLLGGILYYLLTGLAPHGARPGPAAFLQAAQEDVLPPAVRVPDQTVPQELSDLAMGVLQRDPEQRRPHTVEGFISALEEYLGGAAQKRRSHQLTDSLRMAYTPRDDASDLTYGELNRALEQVHEAEALWSDNPAVPELRQGLLRTYIHLALSQNDLMLAQVHADQLAAGPEREEWLRNVERTQRRQHSIQRQRRLALGGLLVLAFLLLAGGWFYLYQQDLAAERLTRQRDAARVARAEAESLMTFMLEDLWERLLEIERADVMDSVARRAAEYYDEWDPAESSPEERANRATAFATIGQALFFQGEMEEALIAYRRAASIFRQLTQEQPDQPHYLGHVNALREIALIHSDLGDKLLALEQYELTRQLIDQALAVRPDDVDLRAELFSTLDGAGIVYYDLGRLEEARLYFERAVTLARDLRRLHPETTSPLLGEDAAYRLALTLFETGQPEAALEQASRAVAIHQEHSSLGVSLTSLAIAEAIRAQILVALDRPDEAAEHLRTLEPRLHAQIAQDPYNTEIRYSTTVLLLELATCEQRLGRTAAARAAWSRVVEIVEEVRLRAEGHAYLRDSLVRALLHLGRVEHARPIAQDLLSKGWTHQDFEQLCQRYDISTMSN